MIVTLAPIVIVLRFITRKCDTKARTDFILGVIRRVLNIISSTISISSAPHRFYGENKRKSEKSNSVYNTIRETNSELNTGSSVDLF